MSPRPLLLTHTHTLNIIVISPKVVGGCRIGTLRSADTRILHSTFTSACLPTSLCWTFVGICEIVTSRSSPGAVPLIPQTGVVPSYLRPLEVCHCQSDLGNPPPRFFPLPTFFVPLNLLKCLGLVLPRVRRTLLEQWLPVPVRTDNPSNIWFCLL